MDASVDGFNPQETVNPHFHGDHLFAPHQRRRGLPMGKLTSPCCASMYVDGLDHFVKDVLRYVDDFALFRDDRKALA